MHVIKPLKSVNTSMKKIFLAGSIDMGEAENWQERIEKELEKEQVVLFNPRRDDWDSTWVQDISNGKFRSQVEWELEHMEKADLVVYYFDPKGKAPITLLELGLNVGFGADCIVCCPEGYWRRGNVQVVCNWYDIPLYDNIDEFVKAIKEYIKKN